MPKKNALFAVPLVLLLLLAACGGASDPVEGNPNDAVEPPASEAEAEPVEEDIEVDASGDVFPLDIPPREPPNPVNVVVTAEEGNTASARIEPDVGGTLTVTGADGTTYTLSIPAGALFSRETISMTPISTMEGTPFENDGTLGVQFEPEGLVLMVPGSLIIQVADGTDVNSLVGFGTYIDGEDFYLKPWEIGENSIQIQVTHFSSGGAITVVGSEEFSGPLNLARGMGAGYSPTHGEAWFNQELAGSFTPTESDEEFADVYEQALKQWFNYTIRDGLVDAAGGVISVEQVMAEIKRWQDFVLTPPEPLTRNEFASRFQAEFEHMWNGLAKAIKFNIDAAEQKCLAGDANKAVAMARYYLMAKNIDRIGEDGTRPGYLFGREGLDIDEVVEQIENCFRFDLSFRSRVTAPFGGGDFVAQVAVKDVDMSLDLSADKIHATVDLPYEYLEFTVPGANCTESGIKGTIRFELYANFNVSYRAQRVEKMELDFVFVTSPKESWNCGAPLTTSFWHAHFADANDITGRPQDITVDLDIVNSGGIFAKWDFDDETILGGHDTSMITLEHTPGE